MRQVVIAALVVLGLARVSDGAAPAVSVTIRGAAATYDDAALRKIVVDALAGAPIGTRRVDVSVQLSLEGAGRHTDVSARLGVIVSDARGTMTSCMSNAATVRVPRSAVRAGAEQAVQTAIANVAGSLRAQLTR